MLNLRTIKNKIIVGTRNFIFKVYDKIPFLGRPLVFVWGIVDNVKSWFEIAALQFRARLMRGDDVLRKELALFKFKDGGLYQPPMHAGLKDTVFLRQGESRFKIIRDNLGVKGGTLLDIGANLGYFCHKFESEGFSCTAVEMNRMHCYFMEKFRKAEGKKFKIVSQSVFDYCRNKELSFDVILALSVFHNFLQREDTYLELLKLLGRLRAKELFLETYDFDPANPPKGYYKNYAPQDFVNLIIQNSIFKKAEFIGRSEEGRPFYKFTVA